MNFLHLKYFLMVAEELNITRAAERLCIDQKPSGGRPAERCLRRKEEERWNGMWSARAAA